jgi:hypothetical protein
MTRAAGLVSILAISLASIQEKLASMASTKTARE